MTTSISGAGSKTASPPAGISGDEWQTRVDLAAAYRFSALRGWDELTFAHLSARVPGVEDQFLMHSAELLFEEVTASNLHKLDKDGKHVVPSSEIPHSFAFPFHKGIYDAFEQAQCVIHLHTRYGTAVAFQQDGLQTGNQYPLWLGPVGYHTYEGLLSTQEEGGRLARAFGDGQVVIQRGHGFVLWGKSVNEAVMLAHVLDRACETQILAQAGGAKLYEVSQDCRNQSFAEGWKIILRGDAPFNRMTWRAIHRKLQREAPGYDR